MSTYVLVHGAWHGSWCWKRVRKALQAQGHEVFTPTLTGVGERSHLLSPQVNLETHINDVVSLIRWEELSDVVLCGHSYGGVVVSGVADRMPRQIRALIYLDAFVLEDGRSLLDELPPDQKNIQLEGARLQGEGWRVPPIPAAAFAVNAKDAAWADQQCTMHPLACFQQPLRLTEKNGAVKDVTYILATGYADSPFLPSHERAKQRGWKTLSLACGHDVMLDMPDELTTILLNAAPRGAASGA
ncbi:MAG TPA: alpha/beta fold hydrolase [Candidatus Acidoferrales bacterium]|jgi:pimeloyl-ACP methyl ester carboxylesterase|nr:alpha/beta fold hydrolase [Candidatus Acidoferrales bacterium]